MNKQGFNQHYGRNDWMHDMFAPRIAEMKAEEETKALWTAACDHDGIPADSRFVVWSDNNPYAASYNSAMGRLLELRNTGKVRVR